MVLLPEIQRMLVQLQEYDVDLVYVSGKSISVADTVMHLFI